jgi:hypothetical protein
MSANPLRDPPEATVDLYPGLVVDDEVQTGSITFGRSRLPAWCVTSMDREDDLARYGWTYDRFMEFVCNLLDSRGELARLLLVMADVSRQRAARFAPDGWWTKRDKAALKAALLRCLACLES